jgi:hypothetical protein
MSVTVQQINNMVARLSGIKPLARRLECGFAVSWWITNNLVYEGRRSYEQGAVDRLFGVDIVVRADMDPLAYRLVDTEDKEITSGLLRTRS